MFTGIIETTGTVKEVISNGSNISFWIDSKISSFLHRDQSVAHDGVCLTIEDVNGTAHRVTAVIETLDKTNLGEWKGGTVVNLERCMQINDRIEGHIVQGHVDCRAECMSVTEKNGSTEFEFEIPKKFSSLVFEKGSVCVNGISLTCFDVKKKTFRVTIIPHTIKHTNIGQVKKGGCVNIEFDMISKIILRKLSLEKG